MLLYLAVGLGYAAIGGMIHPDSDIGCVLCFQGIFPWLIIDLLFWPLFPFFSIMTGIMAVDPILMVEGFMQLVIIAIVFIGWGAVVKLPKKKTT